MEQLKAAFHSGSPRFVTVSGSSGVGKTALVSRFANDIENREQGAWFLTGKFDLQASSTPYSALAIALDRLVEEFSQGVRAALETNPMDLDEAALVCGVVPSLADILLPAESSVNNVLQVDHDVSPGVFRAERIRDALVSLLRRFAKDLRVVVFLDDVHWADDASLSVLQCLVDEERNESGASVETKNDLMLILSFRTNEVGHGAPALTTMLENSPDHLALELRNLSVKDLNEVVVHAVEQRRLGGNEDDTIELTEIIHRKTGGNGE